MALMNFSLPFSGTVAASNWVTATTPQPIQHHVTAVNNLLYSPQNHQSPSDSTFSTQQQTHEFYKNDPYAPPATPSPTQYQRQTYHYRSRNNYLPPPLSSLNSKQLPPQHQQQHIPQLQPPLSTDPQARTITNYQQSHHTTRTYGESSYESHEFYNENISSRLNTSDVNSQVPAYDSIATPQPPHLTHQSQANVVRGDKTQSAFPPNRPTYTQVQAGHGSKTQVHAVLDYDNDEYYDEENVGKNEQKTQILLRY